MTDDIKFSDVDLPGLYKASDKASLDAQFWYFVSLGGYLLFLILAAAIAFGFNQSTGGAIASALLFIFTLTILIALRVMRPDDTWYNGRAVAESVKTRSWRWMMRAEPYDDCDSEVIATKQFIGELRAILDQNQKLAVKLPTHVYMTAPISDAMRRIRSLSLEKRLDAYKTERIHNQADWYSKKAIFNRKQSRKLFWISVSLHLIAIAMLLFRIHSPNFPLPIGVVSAAASAVLTWLQARKHNELASSYSLTAHEIVLIKGEAESVVSEKEFADFVVNTENAFSREHTQWAARKNN